MEIMRSGMQPLSRRIAASSMSLKEVPDDRDQIARQLIEAYAQLAVTPPNRDGSRAVTLGEFGRAEVHLTKLPPEHTGSSLPHLWFEVFSRADGTTIDGYGCFDLDEGELTAAVDLILDVRRHYRSGATCS